MSREQWRDLILDSVLAYDNGDPTLFDLLLNQIMTLDTLLGSDAGKGGIVAEPSKELTQALNSMRDEFMRLHAAFYAGTLGAEEQAELAKHCNDMLEQTAKIGKGTVRPPVQQVYATASELDGEEVTYLKKIQSQKMSEGFDIKGFNRVIKDPFAIKGKIVKEGDKI